MHCYCSLERRAVWAVLPPTFPCSVLKYHVSCSMFPAYSEYDSESNLMVSWRDDQPNCVDVGCIMGDRVVEERTHLSIARNENTPSLTYTKARKKYLSGNLSTLNTHLGHSSQLHCIVERHRSLSDRHHHQGRTVVATNALKCDHHSSWCTSASDE